MRPTPMELKGSLFSPIRIEGSKGSWIIPALREEDLNGSLPRRSFILVPSSVLTCELPAGFFRGLFRVG